jgi:tRNA-2-methylthio-N6-dimethylallyladenosine synthase
MATVRITYAAPHHLLAEEPPLAVRRTRSGDAWERRETGRQETSPGSSVLLGLPGVGAPAPQPADGGGCTVC